MAPKSIVDYERAQRRAACAVCSLSEEIREQVRIARKKKIPQGMVLSFLKDEYQIELKRQDFVVHSAAHHDNWDEEES
jgi:hypothetical protein